MVTFPFLSVMIEERVMFGWKDFIMISWRNVFERLFKYPMCGEKITVDFNKVVNYVKIT